MGIKGIIILIVLLSFFVIVLGVYLNLITIHFSFSFATFALAILGVGAFLVSAGAVLPKGGRSGLSTMAIGGTLLVLSALSTLSISIV